MLKLKPGVNAAHVQPELLLGLMVVNDVFRAAGHDCVITSLFEGKHGANTLHQRDGLCRAADIRTKMLPPEIVPNMLVEMKANLGQDYDLVYESAGTPNEHMHMEYDPKPITVKLT